jgi:prolipoprotein diacylglyceryltransferase
MLPRLFRIPVLGLPVHAYGFMLMLGFVFATMVIVKRAKRDKFDGETLLDLSIYIMLSGIVGARIAYLIIFHHEFDWGIFNLGDGGMSFLGAVAGWIIPVAIFAYKGGFKPKEPRSWGSFIKVLGLLLFGCVAGSVVLGRIVYVFQHRQIYSLEVMEFWRGGLVYYGGVTAGFIVGALFLRYKKIPVWRIGDLVAAPAALGLAFGREDRAELPAGDEIPAHRGARPLFVRAGDQRFARLHAPRENAPRPSRCRPQPSGSSGSAV